jgi:hypothetical protein
MKLKYTVDESSSTYSEKGGLKELFREKLCSLYLQENTTTPFVTMSTISNDVEGFGAMILY